MNAMENKRLIVIGGGVSGLTAALQLKRLGADVILLESSARVGGVIGTFEKDGFKAESGTNSVMVNSQKTLDFIDSLGLKDETVISSPAAKKRFFVRYGKPQAVPMSPPAFLFSKLFSPLCKLRILCEPFIKPEDPDSEPSVAEFTLHRFGKEVLDYAMNPFMAGIYGGSPEKLSVKYAFPPFWNLVQKYGSIIRGGMKSRKDKMAAGNYFKPLMISFKGGMRVLTDKIAEELGDSVKTSAKLISIDVNDGKWQVSWGTASEDVCEDYDGIVLAVPSPKLAKIPFCGALDRALEPLKKIVYAPIATYTMGFKKEDVPHKLDGFGALVPQKEDFSILGSLFVSSIFDERAPESCVTLTNYIGGERYPELAMLPQEELREIILKDLRKMLGLKGEPIFEKLFAWKHGIAQYRIGYGEILEEIDKIEKENENLILLGAYRGGVGVSNCLENAIERAIKLSKELE